MYKFKIGDEIVVTAGRDKGAKGKIEQILKEENKIVVPQVNVYKRHRKATRTQASGIYQVNRPIPIANVAIICPKCSKKTRVGFKKEGKDKYRVCKKCQSRLT